MGIILHSSHDGNPNQGRRVVNQQEDDRLVRLLHEALSPSTSRSPLLLHWEGQEVSASADVVDDLVHENPQIVANLLDEQGAEDW